MDFNWFKYFYFLLFQINLIFVVKLVFVAFWFEGAGVNGVGNVSGKSTWGGGEFNKAGFDGASEKPVWIWNFTGGVFWEDFVFLKTENENIMVNPQKESFIFSQKNLDNTKYYFHDQYMKGGGEGYFDFSGFFFFLEEKI